MTVTTSHTSLPQIHSSDSHGPSHLRVPKPWPKWTAPPPGDSSGAGRRCKWSSQAVKRQQRHHRHCHPQANNGLSFGRAPDGGPQARINKGGRDYTGGARYRQDEAHTAGPLSNTKECEATGQGEARGADAASPILIITESNRSLDALLEGILPHVDGPKSLARVGAPSELPKLAPCELRARVGEVRGQDLEHAKAWKALSTKQREIRRRIDELIEMLSQREPTAEDVEEVCTTAQIMSMCAAPSGWLHIEEALMTWLEPVRHKPQQQPASTHHPHHSPPSPLTTTTSPPHPSPPLPLPPQPSPPQVRKAADERAAEALLAEAQKGMNGGSGGSVKVLLTAAEEAAARAAKAAAAATGQPQRLVRSVGNRKADWAAVTRVEYAEAAAAEDEEWEEQLLVAASHEPQPRATSQAKQPLTLLLTPPPLPLPPPSPGESIPPLTDHLPPPTLHPPHGGHGADLHEDEGDHLPLTRVDDIGWPDEATIEMLNEHDDLWQLDTVHREQLAWLWLHKKFEGLYSKLAELCERYEKLCRYAPGSHTATATATHTFTPSPSLPSTHPHTLHSPLPPLHTQTATSPSSISTST